MIDKDSIINDAVDYPTKMRRKGVWDGNWKIQAFIEVYNINASIHELEPALELSYKFINPEASIISIF